ncbi:hypothetical protein BG011_000311 [Mortierella polycephala]|uniref:Uncharacterized protein n=1 Tax=Mortierella polycephala TaxID=41804 RepID=A0A9P6U6W3_9FUNG|nr:hypothetical protein BG011_000311 [Mortierella polycephala]
MRWDKWLDKKPELGTTFYYTKHDFKLVHSRRLHLELTGQLLRRTLARRDYKRAYRLYCILISSREISEDLVWKIGAELLRQKKEYEPLCVRFLQQVFAKATYCRESILLETTLYQLRCGKIEEAQRTLDPHLDMSPYDRNPLLQGYAGVVQYALWNMAVQEKRRSKPLSQQSDDWETSKGLSQGYKDHSIIVSATDQGDEEDDWLDGEDEDDAPPELIQLNARISRHRSLATELLKRSLEMDRKNDMFLIYLFRLTCGKIDWAGLGKKAISRTRKAAMLEMKGFLKQFYNKNNDSLLSLRLLAALENRREQRTLELILKHDPATDSLLYVRPLLRILKRQIPEEQEAIAARIEQEGFDNTMAFITHNHWHRWDYRENDPMSLLDWLDKQIPSTLGARWNGRRTAAYPRINPTEQADTCNRAYFKTQAALSRHQPDVKYFRPILQLLLTRAEFGVMTDWEEKEIVRISRLFCFCSFYCRRVATHQEVSLPRDISGFDRIAIGEQPCWYSAVASILSREDEP